MPMHVMHSGCESLSKMDASHDVGQGREALPASLDSDPLAGDTGADMSSVLTDDQDKSRCYTLVWQMALDS